MKIRSVSIIPALLLTFLFSACGSSADVTPTETLSLDGVYTAAAATLAAQASLSTPTMTLLPTASPTLWASPTYQPSTPTMQSVSVSYSTANGCYNAAYVSDVTIPDGTELAPGEIFTKTWKFQNTGSCDWETDFVLAFEAGTDMDGVDTTIDETASAGDTASLSVSLVAPESAGTYTGYWRLTTDSGDAFGQSVYVLIVVSEDAATSTPTATATLTPTEVDPTATETPTFTPIPTEEALDLMVEPTSTTEEGS